MEPSNDNADDALESMAERSSFAFFSADDAGAPLERLRADVADSLETSRRLLI